MAGCVRVTAAGMLVLVPAAAWAQASPRAVELPTIEVVESSPLSPADLDRDKVPANVQSLSAPDFDHAKSPDLLQAIGQHLPGVTLSDQTGNPFQLDLNYRGFTASPVLGTPQGIAVYQNGVRINEVFGDTVNWDLIPEMAIQRMTLVPNNPIYGLNALGGALSLEMKNGFTYQGVEGEVRGGSFGRRAVAGQAGGQNGNWAAYVAADAINDDGWRDHSPSQLRRMYADVGARYDKSEFHVNFTGASNDLAGITVTPIELLSRRWNSVYTWPQTTQNDLAFLSGNGSHRATDTLSFQGNVYYRGFWQRHVDANTSEAQPCTDPKLLCIGDDTTSLIQGQKVPNPFPSGTVFGEIDRTRTAANSFGGSLQATSTQRVFEHDNHFVVGVSLDHGRVQYTGNSELGTIGQDLFVTGTGVFIDQPAGDVALHRHLRHRYARRDGEARGDGRRALQHRGDQARGRDRHRAQRQRKILPLQSGDRRDLQDRAGAHGLCRLFGGEPCADPTRARLRRSDAAVPDRQFPGLRPALEAGGLAHLRGRPVRAAGPGRGQRPPELEPRPVPDRQYRRHHQYCEPDRRTRIFPERRQDAAGRPRGQRLLQAGPLDRVCQLHLHRRDLPEPADPVVAEQSCGRERGNLRRSRRSYSGGAAASLQGRRRVRGNRAVEDRSGSQRRRQPIFGRRPIQPESEGAGLLGGKSPHLVPGLQARRAVRPGAEPVRSALLHVRDVLRSPRDPVPRTDRPSHLGARHAARGLCRAARDVLMPQNSSPNCTLA